MAIALFLAGPSCSGKTELGRALQELLSQPWLLWEADRCQPLFPSRREFATIKNDQKMVEANLRAIRSYVESGFNVIAEVFVWDEPSLKVMRDLFSDYLSLVVKLSCPLEILEKRERDRGTTYVGIARQQSERYDRDFEADFILDTSDSAPEQLARQVAEWLDESGRLQS